MNNTSFSLSGFSNRLQNSVLGKSINSFSLSGAEDQTQSSVITWSWVPWVGFILGIVVLGQLYVELSQRSVTFMFERFWLGMFLFCIPAFWRLMSARVSRSERVALIIGLGFFTYLPKLFRCPYYFCYSDELTWWRGVQNMLSSGDLLANNPLGLVQGNFPGLSILTITLQKASGLSTFHTGLILIAATHVLNLITIFLLSEYIFKSSWVGSAAAVVFLMNPNFMYFEAQFSYESIAIPLLLIVLVGVLYAVEEEERRSRIGWAVAIFIIATALVVTHHLTSYFLAVILILMAVSTKWLRSFIPVKYPRVLYGLASYVTLTALAWEIFIARGVPEYLGDPIAQGLKQVVSFQVRKLFSNIALPWYEIGSGYLAAVLLVLLGLLGIWLLLKRFSALNKAQVGLLSIALLYFLVIPMVLTPWGSEAGHRSWSFSFIGLAPLVALALAWIALPKSVDMRRNSILSRQAGATIILAVLLLGGVASSTSLSYRFPGEYQYISDARSYTPEVINAATWMLNQLGSGNRFMGDRTVETIFGSYGLQEPAMFGGPRPWETFMPVSWTPNALDSLRQAQVSYVAVDKRIAELPPTMAFRFQRGEPLDNQADSPLPPGSIGKFDQLQQLNRVFDSGNIRIYQNTDAYQNTHLNTSEMILADNNLVTDTQSRQTAFGVSTLNAIRLIMILFLFLIGPGYVAGAILFPTWSQLEIVTRLVITLGLSLSIVIILTLLLGLSPLGVRNSWLVELPLFGLALLTLIGIQLARRRKSPGAFDSSGNSGAAVNKGMRISRTGFVIVLGGVGFVLVMLFIGNITPRNEPYTIFALNPPVNDQLLIINHEQGEQTYRVEVHGEGTDRLDTQPFQVAENQSKVINFSQIGVLTPQQGTIEVDLFMNGQQEPYRTLHFFNPESAR